MSKKKSSKEPEEYGPKEYERLGRIMVSVGQIGYRDKKALYIAEFSKGVVRGFGSIIGATIVIGLLLFLLSLIDSIPFIGDIASSVKEAIDSPSN